MKLNFHLTIDKDKLNEEIYVDIFEITYLFTFSTGYCGILMTKEEEFHIKRDKAFANNRETFLDSLRANNIISNRPQKIASIPDWASLVTPPYNQYNNNSCWAHSAAGIMEGLLGYLHGSCLNLHHDYSDVPNFGAATWPWYVDSTFVLMQKGRFFNRPFFAF